MSSQPPFVQDGLKGRISAVQWKSFSEVRDENSSCLEARKICKVSLKIMYIMSTILEVRLDSRTQFCRKRDWGGEGHLPPPPTDNFWRAKLIPTNYISLEREFIIYWRLRFILDIEKYFDFATDFREMLRTGSRMAVSYNIRLLKY